MTDTSTPKSSSPILIVIAWLVVLIPAGWGLNYTAQNAMKLFNRTPPPAAAPAATPAATPAPAAK